MHFPADRDADTLPWRGRKIYMGPTAPGDEPVAMAAAGSEQFLGHSDPLNRALYRDLRWFEGGGDVHHLEVEETLADIALCSQRLELNTRLLEELPAKVEAQAALVEDNRAKLVAAHDAVTRVVLDDQEWLDARGFQWKPSGTIMVRHATIAPGVRIQHRQCELKDTAEWKRYAPLEARSKSSTSPETRALQELDRLQKQLKDERILCDRLGSRLYDLRENLRWWENEAAELGVTA